MPYWLLLVLVALYFATQPACSSFTFFAISGSITSRSALAGYWSVSTGSNVVLASGLLSGTMADISVGGTVYGWQEFIGKTLSDAVYKSSSSANEQLVGGKADDTLSGTGGGSTFWGSAGSQFVTSNGCSPMNL